MKNAIVIGSLGLAASFAMLTFGFVAGRAPAGPAMEPQVIADAGSPPRAEVETIIRDYLVANPEIMLEVQAALEAKQKEEQKLAQLGVIADAKTDIFNANYDGIVGNPKGKVTIVEFYDYNCGFCKRAQADMLALTKENPDLRFVLKEFPILGPDSQKAHVVSMAFRTLAPEKYAEFHNELLGGPGRAGEATAMKIALSLGVDEAALRKEMENPAIAESFAKTYDIANRLSITGTPSYVIGNEVVFGAMGKDVLEEKVAAVRAACSAAAC